jgi:hypothetical protein
MTRLEILDRWRQLKAELDVIDETIAARFSRVERGELSPAKCDEHNADDRERAHELAGALSTLFAEAEKAWKPEFTKRQLAVVQEALGDAYAFRTNSGEDALEDLDDYERQACERYRALANELGLEAY